MAGGNDAVQVAISALVAAREQLDAQLSSLAATLSDSERATLEAEADVQGYGWIVYSPAGDEPDADADVSGFALPALGNVGSILPKPSVGQFGTRPVLTRLQRPGGGLAEEDNTGCGNTGCNPGCDKACPKGSSL
jgi:hypothetical protein